MGRGLIRGGDDMINAFCPKNIYLSVKQARKLYNFIFGDDLDFYEEFTIHLSDEEQEKFFDDNPDFMSNFPIKRDKMYLLKNRMFRKILRKIKKCEGGKG